ncbi:MAG: hypothetical protein JW917_01305 [Ignavibacteria bacterium]|nr:hypothetical protein [Ignavibacteria bacterium]
MKIEILILLVAVLICNLLQAQDSKDNNPEIISKKLDLKEQVIGSKNELILKENKFSNDIFAKKTDNNEKNPILAAALSVVVPGAGQFYAKSFVKSAVFLGLEAGLWITYAIFQKKGDNQTNFYRKYADDNWSVRKYAEWLKTEGFSGSGSIDPGIENLEILRMQINACEDSAGFSHKLPPYGDQQYYEVIGKYQNYVSGWSEATGVTKNNYQSYKLAQVDYYMNERELANTYYNNGSLTLTVVILNHLLSAADAVWSVSLFNKSLEVRTSVNVKYIYSASNFKYNLTPFANLSLSF